METTKQICIVCETNEVNPMITDSDPIRNPGKSFCSRTCQGLWLDSSIEYWPFESIKRLALKILAEQKEK